jgi:hypothetical protein
MDSTFASGKIGFTATNALAWLGDVVVTTLPGPAGAAVTQRAATSANGFAAYDAVFATLFNQSNGWGWWRW